MPKRIDEVNDHSLGRPKHLTKYMRMNHVPLYVFTLQLVNKTIFHGDFFSPTWQTKITNSESNFGIPSIQAHMCLYREFAFQAQSQYRHTFSVSQVCACTGYLL